MTSSEPDPAATAPLRRQSLDERYGVESPTSRRIRQVAVAVVALALLGWVGWAAWSHSQIDVDGRLTSFDVVSEHEVEVVAVVTRRAGQAVACDVVAQAEDHTSVGEGRLTVPAGDTTEVTATATIRTDREATSATVSNCRSVD